MAHDEDQVNWSPEDAGEPHGTGGCGFPEAENVIDPDAFPPERLPTDEELEAMYQDWLSTHVEPELPLIDHPGYARLERDLAESMGVARVIGDTLNSAF